MATEEEREERPEEGAKRSLVLRPDDWNPTVAAGIVFVVVVLVLGFVTLVLIGAFTTDKAPPPASLPQVELSPRLKQVETCLQGAGVAVTTDGLNDFVAENALGGAVKAPLEGNIVTISDGLTPAGAIGIVHGYKRLAGNLPLAQLLRREGRFALLWSSRPVAGQTATIVPCLR